ncbi:PAS domain S-box-containing protein [Devosia lucknowensis]|uniref:Blue-light-activated histidine kinase n=1 Tax=Devosia lucknowensis TaxID=1096929 RepID=A0A1Y6GAV4_9HYPH|nr:HWE histidine kinase domain-containing protein [Devosia lucknowensis]SMQ85557.1 PAS domain S-box-containing protein [Devosia lucknowensis]
MTGQDISELRTRLEEAEDTLRAIRAGEIDALVIDTPDSAEIFTLEGEGQSYRNFLEAMDVGAAALDGEGRILYVNTNLMSALGTALNSWHGLRFADVLDADVAARIDALAGSVHGSAEISLTRHGQPTHFAVSARPMRLGAVQGHAVTFTDITQRVEAELALQSERAARAVIASANEAVLVCGLDGVVTHANVAAQNVYEGDPVGQRFADIVPLIFPGATGMVQSADIVDMAIGGSAVQGIEATAPNAPRIKDYQVSAAPLHVGDESISGCVITMVDLTHRKAAEKQQLLLMRELDHRVKNTLALVLSIAGRTMHHEDTLEGFHAAFTGRIQALAATHNLLAENGWTDLTIADVVQAELAPHAGGSGRFVTEGLHHAITPRAAIALGLVIHELATNAAKYGALSATNGKVTVIALGNPDKDAFALEWRESGGPPVATPARRGFGQNVITRSLQYSPHGGAEVDYRPEGVVCRISLPREDMR